MPDCSPLNKAKLKTLKQRQISPQNSGKRKYTLEESRKNLQASNACRKTIVQARREAVADI